MIVWLLAIYREEYIVNRVANQITAFEIAYTGMILLITDSKLSPTQALALAPALVISRDHQGMPRDQVDLGVGCQ